MVNICQSYGGLPVYFIRWNPDKYKPKNEMKEPEDIKKRYKLVGELIKSILDNRITLPLSLLSVIYLYYDNYDTFVKELWQVILNYENENKNKTIIEIN
jgi:hypothetical protein